jgi:hypothetical protein
MTIKIDKGNCVMCNRKGEYLTEDTNELLCENCWNVNEMLKKQRKNR